EPREGEWRMAVRVAPRLEVIAYENAVEAAPFSFDRELEQRARSELLGRSLVSKPEHGYLTSAPVVTLPAEADAARRRRDQDDAQRHQAAAVECRDRAEQHQREHKHRQQHHDKKRGGADSHTASLRAD